MDETAKLEFEGKTYELPVLVGSEGERSIDIGKLRDESGLITLDPGYKNTGSTTSQICFIDGEQGVLRYRGFAIEDLAEQSSFLEVAYLLIHGELPSQQEYDSWLESLRYHTMLHEDVKRLFEAFPKDAHPMAVAASVVSAISTFYPEDLDPEDEAQVVVSSNRLIAKFPTIAAYAHKHSLGQPFLYPDNKLGYVDNFLRLMFGTPCEEFEVDPVVSRAIELLLILHADHEQNCSTSTVRIVGSSHANLFASIGAGINALWGPRHGGANQQVIEMLDSIAEEGLSAQQFVDRAKDRDDTSRLMGFGHRVYRNYDPRAKVIKQSANEVLEKLGATSKLLEIAVDLERIALEDEYFVKRRLYPNVDFYSGVIYKALGIPVNSFTVMFAMGRLPGWIAHWVELHRDAQAIGRPRQIYTGPSSGLQELRPAREGNQAIRQRGTREARRDEQAARNRRRSRAHRARGRVLRQAPLVPKRRLLLRGDLQGAGHSGEQLHGHVRHGPAARLDRALGRAAQGRPSDRAPPADLHGTLYTPTTAPRSHSFNSIRGGKALSTPAIPLLEPPQIQLKSCAPTRR